MFLLSHDERCSCPSLGQIYVQVYAPIFNCCVYPSASAAFKNRVMKPISSANEASWMKNHLCSLNTSAQLWCPCNSRYICLSLPFFMLCHMPHRFFNSWHFPLVVFASPDAEEAKVLLGSLDGSDSNQVPGYPGPGAATGAGRWRQVLMNQLMLSIF